MKEGRMGKEQIYPVNKLHRERRFGLIQQSRLAVVLTGATVISWLGEVIHNAIEFPHMSVLSPENSLPGLIAAVLLTACTISRFSRLSLGLLFGWGALNLVGGVITVLPLGF